MKAVAGLLIFGTLAAAAAEPFSYSFEDPSDLQDWTADPGIALEVSEGFASEGRSSLKLMANAGVPWFGMRQDVDMADFREFEYLEFDLKTLTKIGEFACELRADRFQNLVIKWDQLKPGQTLKVRIRLADNEIVKFGDKANLSFWFANRSPDTQALYLDNLRLTGRGPAGRRLEALRGKAAKRPEAAALVAKIDEALKGPEPVAPAAAESLENEWDRLLIGGWQAQGLAPLVVLKESSMRKIAREASLAELSPDEPVGTADISLARNEYGNFQLVAAALDAPVPDVQVSATPLKSASGKTLPADVVTLSLVDEVDIWGTLQFPGDWIAGSIPDPLLPNRAFAVEPGKLRCVWVNVFAPAETPAGTYEGALVVSASGREVRRIPLKVTVWDFTLPEKNSLKAIFTLWSHNWLNFYRYASLPYGGWFARPSFEDIPMDKKMALIEFCNRYRMGVSEMMTMPIFRKSVLPTPGLDEMLKDLQKTNSAFVISMLEGNAVRPDGSMDEEAVALIREKVREVTAKVPPGSAYVYMLDEPHRQTDKGGWAAMQKEAEMIHREVPGAKNFLASGVFLPPAGDPSVEAIDAIAMLWDRTPLVEAAKYQKRGKEIWWYGANVVSKPYPNWGLEYDGICPRILPLMTFKANLDGILHWGVNLWGDDNCLTDSPKRWPEVPWKSTGWPYQAGEGHVFYPGSDGFMWPCIRLENWRDGMEDYEYLVLLKQKWPSLSGAARDRAAELLSLNGVVNEPYDFTRNPETLESWRRDVAAILAP